MQLLGRPGGGAGERSLVGWESALLGVLALGCAVSPLFSGFYDESVWLALTIAVLVVLLAVALAHAELPQGTALITLLGVLGIWLLAYLSRLWSADRGAALTDANRWLLYAATFATLLLLIRGRRHCVFVLGVATVGIVAMAIDTGVRLLGPSGASLLLVGRLNAPLGYVNGEAAFMLAGVWPLIAVLERRLRWWSAIAGGVATWLLCLVALSESRGAFIATGASAVAILLFIPGRRERVWALLAVAAGVATAFPKLLDVYHAHGDAEIQDALHVAVLRAALAAVAVTVVWHLLDTGVRAMRRSRRTRPAAVALARWGPLVIVLTTVAGLLAASPVLVRDARRAYDQFVTLDHPSTTSRLLSGAGNRYDYWRVAAREFQQHPLLGVGAGNYPAQYYLLRRTQEDVIQPHSIEMEMLSELGILGVIALLAFLGGIAGGLRQCARAARTDLDERTIGVAAGGLFISWLVYTSSDWIHRIPGITGFALIAAAVLVAPWVNRRPMPRLGGHRVLPAVGFAVLVMLAILIVARPMIADHLRAEAQSLLASNPHLAINRANAALRLDDESLSTYYVKAAAYARLDDYADARRTLEQALAKVPRNFVTWGLLGDLAVRHGNYAVARAAYRRASALNPRDPVLRSLATGPLPATAF